MQFFSSTILVEMCLMKFFLCTLKLCYIKAAFYTTTDKGAIVKYKDVILNTTAHSLITCTLKCRFVDEEAIAVFEKKHCTCVMIDSKDDDSGKEMTLAGTFLQRKTLKKMTIRRPKISRIDIIGDSFTIKKGHLQKTIPKLTKTFVLSLDVKPTQFLKGYQNVLHLTTGDNYDTHGSRVPCIFFHKSRIEIFTAINEHKNHNMNLQDIIPLNQWTNIRVNQTIDQTGDWRFTVEVNRVIKYSIKNNDPSEYNNVKCYLSDPWHTAQRGSVRNVWLNIFE